MPLSLRSPCAPIKLSPIHMETFSMAPSHLPVLGTFSLEVVVLLFSSPQFFLCASAPPSPPPNEGIRPPTIYLGFPLMISKRVPSSRNPPPLESNVLTFCLSPLTPQIPFNIIRSERNDSNGQLEPPSSHISVQPITLVPSLLAL